MEININFPGGKQVDAQFNNFTIQTDQSVKSGGEGLYPEPFMHFLASLGTCAGIYVLSFCQSRNISMDGISIKQVHEFITLENGKSKLGKIIIKIHLPEDFPEKYKEPLLRAADQCAVKKAILNPPEMEVVTV